MMKATIVMRISAILRLLVAVAICIFVCGLESAASERIAITDPTPTVSRPATFISLMLAKAPQARNDYPFPRFVPKTSTILKLAFAGLVSLGASISLYLKRIADRNNVRQMLDGSSDWYSEMPENRVRNQ